MNLREKAIFSAILGDKKVQIIEFLLQNIDRNGFVNLTIGEISNATDTSKPTIISTFKILQNAGVFERVKNGVYKINVNV